MKSLWWGKLGALVLISFTVHIAMLVNSVQVELERDQAMSGQSLSNELANAATQPTVIHDMVSLSVLISGLAERPDIASVRIFDNKSTALAEYDSDTAVAGHSYSAPISYQGQPIGHVEIELTAISRGEIMRRNQANIALSAAFHFTILVLGLVGASRRQPAAPVREREPEPVAPVAAPVPAAPPAKPVALLYLSIDDPNNLLMRVNASTADELLTVLDHLLDRAARLYGGEISSPFSPSGALVVFNEADPVERAFKAMVCGKLFLALTAGADAQRRAAGLFSLPVKAGLHSAADDQPEERKTAATVAQTAPSGRLLCSVEQIDGDALDRCQPGQSLKLALKNGHELPVVVIERLEAEFQQLVHNQTQQLLGLNTPSVSAAEEDPSPAEA